MIVAPTCAIQAFLEGKPVDIISDHNWRLANFSFKVLLDVDKQTANEILVTNLKRICGEVNELAEVDFEDVYCIKFLHLVQKSNTYAFTRIADLFRPVKYGLDNPFGLYSDYESFRRHFVKYWRNALDIPREDSDELRDIFDGLPAPVRLCP